MSIVIFCESCSFPEGNAATNRVHTYAKGFNKNGISVHVISFANNYISIGNGVFDEIFFYHPFGQKKRNKWFIIRRWKKFIKYFRTIRLVLEINKKDKINVINCWTGSLYIQLFVFILSSSVKSKMILERSEHPLRHYQGSGFNKIIGELNAYSEAFLCNGIFCISQYLIDFYQNRNINHKKLFLVPSTVDNERFQVSGNSPLNFQYILYCGSLTIMKDGVNILIESFAKISEKYSKMNLVLIGKGDIAEEEVIIKELVVSLNIEKRVIFLGQMSREKIPLYLNNAKILALARPKSIIADAGFPSKLTEYLATGVPVVVTKVGEIPEYLSDNDNAFLSEPDSVNAFADKLDFVLSNYEFASEVALKGKELTNTIFNYDFQAKRMINFISTLRKK
ncbi:MAG: glycosyltransferase family 4 protein [Lentimicrobiaceae bacterium]|jgi:glycosyltransferase involved in cell wall biosynthesis